MSTDAELTDTELLKLLTDIKDLCEMWFLRGQPHGHNRQNYNAWLATGYHSKRYIRLLDAIDKIRNSENFAEQSMKQKGKVMP